VNLEILFDTLNHQFLRTLWPLLTFAPTAQGHTGFQPYSIDWRYEFMAQVRFTFSLAPVMARQSLDNSVGVVTRPQTGWPSNRGLIFSNYQKQFCSPKLPDCLWGPHGILFLGYRGLFPRGQSGRFVMLTNPSKAGVKIAKNYTSTPSYVLIVCTSIQKYVAYGDSGAAEWCDN